MSCQVVKSDGTRCKAAAQKGKDCCFWHDPARQAERLDASSRGGKNGAIVIIQRDAHESHRLSVRGIVARYNALLEELEYLKTLEKKDECSRRLRVVKAEIRLLAEMRATIRQVHEEEGKMPPIQVEIEGKLETGLSHLSLEQLERMRDALDKP